MKRLAFTFAAALLFTSTFAHADTAQVICVDEMKADGNTYGGLELALSRLEAKINKTAVKTVSAPVFMSVATPVIVCVTVTR